MMWSGGSWLAEYGDGLPAIVEHPRGEGRIIHAGTMFWLSYFHDNSSAVESLVRGILDKRGIPTYDDEKQALRIRALEGKEGKILFLFNYSEETVKTNVRLGELDRGNCSFTDLDSNEEVIDINPVTVPGRDVRLFRIDVNR